MSEYLPGRVWSAKVGYAGELPAHADLPMRNAVGDAFRSLTGDWPEFVFSGWAAELTEVELAIVENREVDPSYYANERIRKAAPDLLAACEAALVDAKALQKVIFADYPHLGAIIWNLEHAIDRARGA